MKQLPNLYVEGKNDKHVIKNLMQARGIKLDDVDGPVIVKAKDSYVDVLAALKVAPKADLQRCGVVGFVFDIDREEDNRFEQVKNRLSDLGYTLTDAEIRPEGIVKETNEGKIGVWMMPQIGARCGKLEDFLRGLIPNDDKILPIADKYVNTVAAAVESPYRFRDIDVEKAQMASWLAVQHKPGLPYGSAITANLLNPQSPLAEKFYLWMCKVFDL